MKSPSPRVLAAVMVVLVLGGGGLAVEWQRHRARSTLSGFFESQPTIMSSRAGGRVTRILAPEGSQVKTGQPLLEFEARPGDADAAALAALATQARQHWLEVRAGPRREDIRQQAAVVAEMRAALDKLRHGPRDAEISAGRARLREAQANYDRVAHGSRPEDVERLRATAEQARAHWIEAQHGPTEEERQQARARQEGALAQAHLAQVELVRQRELLAGDATSRQAVERAQADFASAQANARVELEAYRRARLGTRPEELEQARQGWMQADAALSLAEHGSRFEDVDAALAQRDTEASNLRLLEEGTRPEDLQAGEARLAQARALQDSLRRGNRPEVIAQAHAAYVAAREQARAAAARAGERRLRAPLDGVVERVLVAVGDLVPAGSPVIRLADPNDLWLRVYLPEESLARVKVGDKAVILVDGVAAGVGGRVESIATQGEFTPANVQTPGDRGKQVFGLRLRLSAPDGTIKAGMAATVMRVGQWP